MTSIVKDLQTYVFNIVAASDKPAIDLKLGDVNDVPEGDEKRFKIFGRQVQYSLIAVNEVGVSAASIPSSTQRKSIVNITLVYADPIFEASGGVFFSTLANRSFAN